MRKKTKKYICIGIATIIGLVCIGLGIKKPLLEKVLTVEMETEEVENHETSFSITIVEENDLDEEKLTIPYQELSYSFGYKKIWEEVPIEIPTLQVYFAEDKQKEATINELIVKRCIEVLPTDELWLQYAQTEVIYRSEKYFCFRYKENKYLPTDYDVTQLYFLVDIEQEKLIDYPKLESDIDIWRFCGNLYEEQNEYGQKTVEEQSALREDTSYELQEDVIDYEGVSFRCVRIEGMENENVQSSVNEVLMEPLKTLIETDENHSQYLETMKIYIAYKSEQWLSVVYAFETSDFEKNWGDEFSDLGVTVNLETGERYMLDDLVDIEEVLFLLCTSSTSNEERWSEELLGCVYTEEELAAHNERRERWICNYNLYWASFYLYSGKLVITKPFSFVDFEIQLPEISQYLKVDPWYE